MPDLLSAGRWRLLEWANPGVPGPWWVLMMAGLLVGCLHTDYGWSKAGGTERDFAHDQAQCRRTIGLGTRGRFDPAQILGFVVEPYRRAMARCLEGKGWMPDRP